jgi:hypothetical protein
MPVGLAPLGETDIVDRLALLLFGIKILEG